MINIVLHEPEMPANTGNIGRTCVATGVRLHLIGPLGFQINDKMLKRAGLDYWDKLDVTEYDDYKDFLAKNPGAKVYMATTKAHKTYTEVNYEEDCYIMFGKESAGIPEEILVDNEDTCGYLRFLALFLDCYVYVRIFFTELNGVVYKIIYNLLDSALVCLNILYTVSICNIEFNALLLACSLECLNSVSDY